MVQNSGMVFGEGEWESPFMKGLKQAFDFASIPGASGSFVISYPDNAKERMAKRIRDSSNPEMAFESVRFRRLLFMKDSKAIIFRGDLAEAYEWLKGGILHKAWKEDRRGLLP